MKSYEDYLTEGFNSYEAVEEGWGMLLTHLLPGGYGLSNITAGEKLLRLMRNGKFKKYIINSCNETYNKAKKENENLSPDWTKANLLTYLKFAKISGSGIFKQIKDGLMSGQAVNVFAKYRVWFQMDTEKIYSAYLLLYDEKSNRFISYLIQAPSKEEIEKMSSEVKEASYMYSYEDCLREASLALTSVEEGWGIAAAKLILNPVLSIPISDYITRKYLDKALQNKEFAKAVIAECDKVYKAKKKEDPNLTNKFSMSKFQKFVSNDMVNIPSWERFVDWFKGGSVVKTVGDYNVFFRCDSEKVISASVLLQDSETDSFKYFPIASPKVEKNVKESSLYLEAFENLFD